VTSPSQQAIGIFDSGIGGLTVAKAIKAKLPNEQLLYFGDTAHLPYGEKSSHAIESYILEIGKFLVANSCKLLVIACNSASSVFDSRPELAEKLNIPVIDVILPVIKKVAHSNGHKIGVIGTHQTIGSNIYSLKLLEENPKLDVQSLATPLLAPMIEEGFINNQISKAVINDYLQQFSGIDSLILGCTHYPLIKREIEDFFEGATNLLDAPDIVANSVKVHLQKHALLSDSRLADDRFYLSDFTSTFERTARLFFGADVHLEEVRMTS
jgi:glutamate racemase